jgi:transmembrane sensor
MSSNPIRLKKLFEKYIQNTCSEQELEEFWQLLSELSDNDTIDLDLKKLWQQQSHTDESSSGSTMNKMKLFDKVMQKVQQQDLSTQRKSYQVHWPYWLAAVFFGSILIASFYYMFSVARRTTKSVIAMDHRSILRNDVAPGIAKALLTLSNGKQILLDSMAAGTISKQGNVAIINMNGRLTYHDSCCSGNEQSRIMAYNTLSTANGNQYELILPDGSKVWLNAASSIHYPVVFADSCRVVEITGEAYFEVVHNPQKPFRVKVGNEVIQVLGTHFNINAYANEPCITITLLKGSLKVTQVTTGQSQLLKPDQQEKVDKEGRMRFIPDADGNEAIAWKNGYFEFDQADIFTVMRQLARWYNLDVSYQGKIPTDRFGGEIERDLNLSEVLELLQKSNVHFRIENTGDDQHKNKLIVLP